MVASDKNTTRQKSFRKSQKRSKHDSNQKTLRKDANTSRSPLEEYCESNPKHLFTNQDKPQLDNSPVDVQDIVFDNHLENLASTKNPTLNENSKKQSFIDVAKADGSQQKIKYGFGVV